MTATATYVSPAGNAEVWHVGGAPEGHVSLAEWRAAQPAPAPATPTAAGLFAMLRRERDARIRATDYLAMPDYPLDEDARGEVTACRQALRDLPAQEGAPWDGGGEMTPWPEMPVVVAPGGEAACA